MAKLDINKGKIDEGTFQREFGEGQRNELQNYRLYSNNEKNVFRISCLSKIIVFDDCQ